MSEVDKVMLKLRKLLAATDPSTEAHRVLAEALPVLDRALGLQRKENQ